MRSLRLLLLGSLLAGATLVVGAGQSSAWTNKCTDEGPPPGGDEIGVDIGIGIVFVGIDVESASLASGNPALGVCVNNEFYEVTTTTVGGPGAGPYVWVNHCAGLTCDRMVDNTGLVGTLSPTTGPGSTTVCVGICTAVPAPLVDTGYDLYVDGTRVSGMCVSIGTAC